MSDDIYEYVTESQTPPTPFAVHDYDGDGVISTKDIILYIVVTAIGAVLAYLK